MSYITVDVEINGGQIVPREPAKLPQKGKGLLTVLEPTQPVPSETMTPMEAFHALKRSLNLDEAKAQAWMDMIRDARR